ncbi:hypothetical protein PAHAL_3G190500 [Panicum hallii]|uniref:Secreted protein n=1 Tax=Panicum hallii TaxID=206008 RepID=A0A2T8KIN3_9POAL|nr:hypothetical protein PAHAL_3G190500 [Panicum hallii]
MNKFQYLFLPLSFSARSICSAACLVAAATSSGTGRAVCRPGSCLLRALLCAAPAPWMFDPVVVVLSRGLPNACRGGADAAAYAGEGGEPVGWLFGPAAGRVWILRTPSSAAGVDTPRHGPPPRGASAAPSIIAESLGGDSSPRREPATFRDLVLTQSSPR